MNNVADDLKREGLGFLQQTWLFVPNWKWIGFAIAIVAGFFLLHFLRWLFTGILTRLCRRSTGDTYRSLLLREPLQRPLALFITSIFWLSALQILAFPEGADKVLKTLLQFCVGWAAISIVYQAVNAGGRRFEVIAKDTPNPLDDQIAPLLSRTARILVIVLGILMILQNVGVNVVSILAGLGLGGLALALAAQDTAANLFGSITILFDRPFQIGDLVKVGDSEGTVEEIGLRSTRLRTAPGTVITVPNSIMAKDKIENFGARPSHRIRHVIGVTYDTSPQKLNEFMDHIRYTLVQHPLVAKDNVAVFFNQFGDSSLNVLVNFYVSTSDLTEELKVQQEILLQIMQIAADNKVDFAFPSRTVYMR